MSEEIENAAVETATIVNYATNQTSQFIEIQSSIVMKYLKQIVGKNMIISTNFKNDFSKILTIFLLYINALSNDLAKERNSKTTSINDIKKVLFEIGFEELIEKMQDFEEKINKTSAEKPNLKRKRISKKTDQNSSTNVDQQDISNNNKKNKDDHIIEIENEEDEQLILENEEDLIEDLQNEKEKEDSKFIQRLDFNNVEQEEENEEDDNLNIDKEIILSDEEVNDILNDINVNINQDQQEQITNNQNLEVEQEENDQFF